MSPGEQIDAYIAGLDDWRGPVLAQVRRAFVAADVGVTEHWKYMGSPVWEHHGTLAVGNAHKEKVKLTFSHGASLEDPDRLLNNGNGKVWRAMDIFEGNTVDEVALGRLVMAAIAFNVGKAKGKK
jgi:hypothetical protein